MQIVVDGLIFQKDPHGGVARIFREALPRLCDLDPDLRITLFTDGPVRGALPAHPGIAHRRLPGVRPTLRPRGLLRRALYPLRRLLGGSWGRARNAWLADLRAAIWHSTFYTLPGDWSGPQVVSVYDLIPERFPALYADPLEELGRQRKRRCVEQAARVICISHATRVLVEAWYHVPPARVTVVYPAYNPVFRVLGEDEGRFPGEPGEAYLLYVGARRGHKNFGALLDAYAGWRGRAHTRLVCAGPGWSPEESRELRTRDLESDVRLLPDPDDKRLCRLYNRAAGFVYPSLEEGFGIPLLEAMACACPIAASRIPSTLEVAGDLPVYFDPADPAGLRAALDRLAQEGRSPARRQAGLRRVQDFSWERTAQGMLEVYRAAAAQAPGASK